MLIDSSVTTILEGMRKLQQMVQTSKTASSAEKLQSQQILSDCESAVYTSFGIDRGLTYPRIREVGTAMSANEITNKVSAMALDMQNIFKMLRKLPATQTKNVLFIRKRDDNHLVKNRFTSQMGHVRAEFGNDTELFYIIQYQDGNYNIASEINVEFM
jgi:hypothetical protein